MPVRILVVLGLLVSPWALSPTIVADSCQALLPEQQRACYQQQYTAADRRLNDVYQRLTSKLEAARKHEMREHSRRWIDYKEAHCVEATGISHSLEPAQAKQHADYFACLYELTVARTAFLQQAFGREGVTTGVAGSYDDSFGGHLVMHQGSGTQHTFRLEVVRGPTYHVGEVEGTVHWQGQKGVFVQTQECGGTTPCCRLMFVQKPTLLALEEDHCEALRGVRAYFAGDYYKIK